MMHPFGLVNQSSLGKEKEKIRLKARHSESISAVGFQLKSDQSSMYP